MKFALSIAGSDPTCGAGLQADLRVFSSLDVHGLTVVAALTAQNTHGVSSAYSVDASQIRAQLNTLLDDIRPSALKTGMLYSADAIRAVTDAVKSYKLDNLVIDPVTVSTSGKVLLEPDAINILRSDLLPLARVITPNLGEAALLTGLNVRTPHDMEDAARALHDMGAEVVIITGGHLEGNEAMEIIYDGKNITRQSSQLMPGSYHGTGCAYSAAITAYLTRDISPLEAASRAKEFITNAINNATHINNKGLGLLKFKGEV